MKISNLMGNSPEVTEYTVVSEKLPDSFDNFKIAHISDSHSHPASNVIELIEASNPGIICFTGDMLHDDDASETKEFDDFFDKLTAIAPVYMVTGNHDLWRHNSKKTFENYRKKGAVLLQNEAVAFKKGDSSIAIFGVDDPFSRLPEVISKNIENSFSHLPDYNTFKLLLFHRANLFDKIKDYGFDLILSGHMHGGQIRLPILGGVCAPTSSMLSGRMVFPKFTSGEFTYEGSTMIVNRGIGNSLKIPRFGNPPQICIITLKKLPQN